MSKPARFIVKSPAQQPSPTGPTPDPNPIYMGTAMNDVMFSPRFGQANVTGGRKDGNRWVACSYTAAPYTIPGLGEVELV